MATLNRSRRGLSLLEVTVAATLFVGLVLALSLTLITESGRRIRHSGMQAGEPPVGRILDRIRTDVWGSSWIAMPVDYDPYATWYEGPLLLTGHWSGYALAYAEREGVLYRIVEKPGEEPVATPVLRQVVEFRWNFLTQKPRVTVLLEVVRAQSAAFRGPDGVAVPKRSVTERIVISPRRYGGTWW